MPLCWYIDGKMGYADNFLKSNPANYDTMALGQNAPQTSETTSLQATSGT